MAGIVLFQYIHKNSIFHRMDGRFKLLCMLLFSLAASFATQLIDFLLITAILLFALAATKLPIKAFIKQMKYFAFLIILVVVVDAFIIPGTPIPNFPVPGVTIEGIKTGVIFSWRLILIIIACTIMSGTTSLITIRNAVEWYLRPVPFIPEVRVATMINLTFVLIPVIFGQYEEMTTAQNARCIGGRRNPIKRMLFLVLPFMTQTLRRTDEIVFAMESRCYSEERTRAIFKSQPSDWLIVIFSFSVLITVIVAG